MSALLRRAPRYAAIGVAILLVLAAVAFGVRYLSFVRDVAESEAAWAVDRPPPLGDIGTTRSLTILPLLDFHTSRADLATDVGVSYLVVTDDHTVLFDLGNNSASADPSPLEHNLAALGVSLASIDTIVVSHPHFDHVGGRRWTEGGLSGTTFGLGDTQPGLPDVRLIAPVPMSYPGHVVEVATDAVRIAPGVATTGSIRRRLFPEWVAEQSLVVHVEGKGIVLVVGCGHPTLARILQRTHALFPQPIVGVVGGLHLPVPEGRIRVAGLDMQRLFGSGGGPFAPLNAAGVDAELALLEAEDLELLAIGGHDSSDAVIADAAARFGRVARPLRVGETLRVAGVPAPP